MSMGRVSSNGVEERIGQLCSEFKLPTVGAEAGPRFTAAGHMDALHTLVEVLEQEAEDRRQRRIIRIRRASRLPVGKTWDTFEHDRVPVALRQQLVELADGSFVERGVNVLAFGLPGTGKTHALCAIGHRLVESGRSVLFTPAYRLVQDMAGGQTRPRPAAHAPQARQHRLPAHRRPRATYPREPRSPRSCSPS